MPLEVENDIECRLGDVGLDVLVGDTDADRLGGELGGVIRGVLVWDAKRRLCDTRGLGAVIFRTKKKCRESQDANLFIFLIILLKRYGIAKWKVFTQIVAHTIRFVILSK